MSNQSFLLRLMKTFGITVKCLQTFRQKATRSDVTDGCPNICVVHTDYVIWVKSYVFFQITKLWGAGGDPQKNPDYISPFFPVETGGYICKFVLLTDD